ncbi:MAG: lytic transglycosylase domain-containing protein [Bdellovibrionota bacterium]
MKHATDCKLLWALAVLMAAGCGKQPDNGPAPDTGTVSTSNGNATGTAPPPAVPNPPAPRPQPPEPAPPVVPPVPAPVPAPAPKPNPTPPLSGGPATWSNLPSGAAWTAAVASAVTANLASFEKAKDRESFCPGYSSASLAQRKTCWVRLVSAVVEYESAFDPGDMYKESDGVYSVGLMQLSNGECANAETVAELKDPVQNLLCGTKKMADLIARYGYVTTPDNLHGAAAYWSTLRAPYTSNGLHLGKKLEVEKITNVFLRVNPV